MPRWLFAVLVLAVLQGLLWVFARSLRFLWGDTRRRWLTAAVFVAGDGLSFAALSRLFPPLFIAQAWLVALLWLWFLAAVVGFVLYRLAKPFAPQQAATALRVFLPTAFATLFAWGFFNANSTVVRHYAVVLDKPLAQPLRLGVATDLHLDSGLFFGARELDRLAAIFAAEQVDIILLPGDIINDKPEAFYAEGMVPHLQALHAPLGCIVINTELVAAKAAELFERACEGGQIFACRNLGHMYVEGDGVDKDLQKGAWFLDAACGNGDFIGCVYLARYLEKVDDISYAKDFYEDACDMGKRDKDIREDRYMMQLWQEACKKRNLR